MRPLGAQVRSSFQQWLRSTSAATKKAWLCSPFRQPWCRLDDSLAI
ncbi:MAG: hypothetical protein GX548_11790 [Lentisphaerae bacterium]|nr:hypothetical protein [Lentisphaerota bacterium]